MQTSGLENNMRVSYFQFDYAKHGGAVGAIAVSGDPIPANAVIVNGLIHCNAAVTSTGSATVAISAVGAADLLAATAVASLSLNSLHVAVPDFATAGHMIRLTSAITSITFTVAVEVLTAGKITVGLTWMLSA